jgi:ankyrin repeat protein
MNNTDLLNAVKNQKLNEVKDILKHNSFQINMKDERGFTPLLYATYTDNVQIVKILLEYNPDVNTQDVTGNTALMGVSFKGNLDMVSLLLSNDADINLTNNQ